MSTEELRKMGAGTRLGRYTLVRKIAAGGMAEVYAARSQGISGFEKKVAIKKILPQFSLNERFIDMLVDEAKITVSLTHPNIAQIYELGLEGDTYYIVMEFVDGRPLNRLMQRLDLDGGQNVPIVHAAHIMSEVSKGLHHAHTKKDSRGEPLGIIHRDITPQNILLAYSGDVKLIDFGIARARGRVAQTSVGTIKGKLRYLAPEIAMADRPDHRADIYCCGIVLFEMLTGEALFNPKTDLEAIELASAARVRSPRVSNPEIPVELENIVLKALKRDRSERYSSAKELYADLRRFLNHHYPAYVGSELGELMEETFSQELSEQRELDRRAESIVDKIEPSRNEATLGVSPEEFSGSADKQEEQTRSSRLPPPRQSRVLDALPSDEVLGTENESYRAVVTRTSIELGSEAFIEGYEDGPEVIQTQESENPLLQKALAGVDRRAPTVAFPPPDEPFDELTANAESPLSAQSAGPIAHPATKSNRIPFSILAGLSALIIGGGIWFGAGTINRNKTTPAQSTPKEQPTQLPAVEVKTASMEIEVNPDVPVDVFINDDLMQRGVNTPVLIENIDPKIRQRLRVSANGFRTLETFETVTAGQVHKVRLTLKAMLGEIELLALPKNARVTANRGKIDGNRIRDIPLGQEVEVTVRRDGYRNWSKKIKIQTEDVIRVEIPASKRIRPGTLFVNSRPFSKVYINGRSRGRTPVSVKLPPGKHRLMLKRPDGKTHSKRVQISAGRKNSFVYRWP